MDTRLLRSFIVVAEEKHLGRAALRLHITQPALTRKIQLLEDQFGARLFTRTNAGMMLTSAGAALVPRAENILSELEFAKTETQLAETNAPERMDIGVYGSAIFNIIPEIIDQFSARNPNVRLALHNTRKEQQIELLRQGKIIIAFDRFFPEERGMVRLTVCKETPHAVLHASHPLAHKATLQLDELRDEPFIGANENVSDDDWERMLGFVPEFGQRVDDVLTAIALVGRGFGVGLAPPSLASLRLPDVVYKPLIEPPGFHFELQCLYRESETSPLLHAMLETVRAYETRL
jgi:LysR family transcriptional regulator, benzoate and cis,cis-muconate-responsive activator of ben and cat genes